MSRPTNDEITKKLNTMPIEPAHKNAVDLANWAIDQALEGMIPANEAIKPDWPHDATYATINYYTSRCVFISESKPIKRPKQPWKPTVGADVFVLMSNMTVIKATVNRIEEVSKAIYFLNNGNEFSVEREYVKPYSAQDEGKTWDEIGGQI